MSQKCTVAPRPHLRSHTRALPRSLARSPPPTVRAARQLRAPPQDPHIHTFKSSSKCSTANPFEGKGVQDTETNADSNFKCGPKRSHVKIFGSEGVPNSLLRPFPVVLSRAFPLAPECCIYWRTSQMFTVCSVTGPFSLSEGVSFLIHNFCV